MTHPSRRRSFLLKHMFFVDVIVVVLLLLLCCCCFVGFVETYVFCWCYCCCVVIVVVVLSFLMKHIFFVDQYLVQQKNNFYKNIFVGVKNKHCICGIFYSTTENNWSGQLSDKVFNLFQKNEYVCKLFQNCIKFWF
jgi:hypothetical protein